MYTQCPDCQTRFRVTAEALRAAHGTVRCGRCGSAFDALPRLSDSLPSARPETPALPIVFQGETDFVPVEAVDLAPVIEAELARLDQAELARLDALEFAAIGEPAAESTIVLVDESGAAEDITLEGDDVTVEGPEQSQPELSPVDEEASAEPTADEPSAGEVSREAQEQAEAGDVDAGPDLDVTDRYEVLRIPASAYPDPQEAEREFEALVQRLQREFEARSVPLEVEAEQDEEDTAETEALPEVAPDDRAADLEEATEEPANEEPAIEELASDEPDAGAQADGRTTEETAASPPAAAAAAPPWEKPVIVPVGERPLSGRRWQDTPEELMPAAEPARSAGSLVAWSIGSVLLALTLAAQVVHHYRQELARDPQFAQVLRSAYERLGVTLQPSWDVGAIELRQWGNDERQGGRMLIRASLTNRAQFAQPFPILRLQFEDRYGVVIAARDFEPTEYLQNPERARRPLAPAESGEAELDLADPGVDAVGYRLEVCLHDSATQLRCAPGPG